MTSTTDERVDPTGEVPSMSSDPVSPRAGERRQLRRVLAATAAVAALLVVIGLGTDVSVALLAGLRFGLILALATVGLSLIYATTGVINFAHGNFLAFGALAAWFLNASPTGPGWFLVPAAAIAVVVSGGLGGLLEWQVMRRIRTRGLSVVSMLVFLIGLEMVTRNALLFGFGNVPLPYRDFVVQEKIRIANIDVLPRDLWCMGIALVVLVGFGLCLRLTPLGQAIRAVADNPALAQASGIPIRRVTVLVWALGTSFAALAGVMLATAQQASWNMGFVVLLVVFAAMVVGGIGNVWGAVFGGILIGVMMQLSSLVISSSLEVGVALLAMIVVLLFRPEGLFTLRRRVG
jgi:neutral amino acid transport system permease protein